MSFVDSPQRSGGQAPRCCDSFCRGMILQDPERVDIWRCVRVKIDAHVRFKGTICTVGREAGCFW